MHLIIDGYGADTDRMWDKTLIRRFLEDYPITLGMTKISEAKVWTYEGPKEEDSGVSGFVIIAESHISIHTFPYRDYVNVDIFSCKSFKNEKALEDVKRLFGFIRIRSWLLDRGLEYLDHRKAAI